MKEQPSAPQYYEAIIQRAHSEMLRAEEAESRIRREIEFFRENAIDPKAAEAEITEKFLPQLEAATQELERATDDWIKASLENQKLTSQ